MVNRLWDQKDANKEKEHLLVLESLGRIVAAYVSNNAMEVAVLPSFIQTVFSTLTHLQHNPQGRSPAQPAVDVDQSITPEYLVCLEDGKKLKMLKRHLRTSYGLTPEQYRERWGLPVDYPMVAPKYAKTRSELARTNGLGLARTKSYTQNGLAGHAVVA